MKQASACSISRRTWSGRDALGHVDHRQRGMVVAVAGQDVDEVPCAGSSATTPYGWRAMRFTDPSSLIPRSEAGSPQLHASMVSSHGFQPTEIQHVGHRKAHVATGRDGRCGKSRGRRRTQSADGPKPEFPSRLVHEMDGHRQRPRHPNADVIALMNCARPGAAEFQKSSVARR